jgi:ubiquinone/menaquinone biosynthesis C-methylase UbiE
VYSPVVLSGNLDSGFRTWLQNPRKVLSPYIEAGMTVLDVGCGPGFFSIDLAQMVGKTGRLIANVLREEMLQKMRNAVTDMEIVVLEAATLEPQRVEGEPRQSF